MEDIIPELYKKIKSEFDGLVSSDEEIQAILSGEKKDMSFAELYPVANRIGNYAARCLSENYKIAELPEGVLHWNIMERTITPIMEEVHRLINKLLFIIQKQIDDKKRIGIKPQEADFPMERIRGVMNMISHLNTEENSYDGFGKDNASIT